MAVYTPVIRLPTSKRRPTISHSNSTDNSSVTTQTHLFEPKDCLVSDTLFLSTLPKNVRETDIRTLLQHCMPIEIIIDQEKDIGQLRFSQPKYADRAYSLYNGFTFTNNTKLQLQMYQDCKLDPEATAALLEINGLPDYYDDNKLYDLFRPFGPLNLCKCVLKDGAFRGTAFIQFFHPWSSHEAERNLNGRLLVDGYELSVVPYTLAASKSKALSTVKEEETTTTTTTTTTTASATATDQDNTTTVDIMNLYIKNLEPHITNQDLTQIFRKFGRIISARVMTNPQTGQSKGYGFVSFGKSEEAALALQEMNGQLLGNRPLMVAYHEPRKGAAASSSSNIIRGQQQQQQQQDYNGYHHGYNNNSNNYNNNNNNNYNNNQRRSSTYTPNNNNNNKNMILPIQSTTQAINGLGIDNVDELGMHQLKDLSIGQNQQQQQYQTTTNNLLNNINHNNNNTPPATIINLPPPRKLSVSATASSPLFIPSPNTAAATATPSSITTAGGNRSLASLASGLSIQQAPPPSHNLHQINLGQNGRPTLRRRGSLESVMTESSANLQRVKLEQAVRNCGDYGKVTNDIVDMLLTLKRKERSLCLFNPDFLKEKVDLALEALVTCNEGSDSDYEEEEEDQENDLDGLDMEYTMRNSRINLPPSYINNSNSIKKPLSPTSPPFYSTTATAQLRPSPIIPPSFTSSNSPPPPLLQQRRVSKAIPIVAPPSSSSTTTIVAPAPAPAPPAAPATASSSSAALSSSSTTTVSLTKENLAAVTTQQEKEQPQQAGASTKRDVEALLKSFSGKPIHEKKQLLGDLLFPMIRIHGVRHAPRVTIRLLDSVPLEELAYAMNNKDKLKILIDQAITSMNA